MQAPIKIGLAAIGQRASHRGGKFPQVIDFAILDPADRRHRLDRGADHETRRRRALAVRPETAAQCRPDQRAQNGFDACAPTAGFFNTRSLVTTRIQGVTSFTFDPGAADVADPRQVAPHDYNAGTNNFHWTQRT